MPAEDLTPARPQIRPQELQAVSALPGAQRYAHAVAQIADWAQIWGLHGHGGSDSGWATARDGHGQPALALWPHAPYAQACASGAWAGLQARPMDVHAFLARMLPPLIAQQARLALFPLPSGAVVLVPAAQFAADLREALAQLE